MRLFALLLLCIAVVMPGMSQDAQRPAITQGPVVESISPNASVIAWSTSVSAGSLVNYGTEPNQLAMRTAMPWGGYTHRVTLRQLEPNTTYYYQALSPSAQGSGETLKSDVRQFHTPQAEIGAVEFGQQP